MLPDSFFKKHSKYGWLYESDMFNNGDDSNKIGWTISLEEMMDDLLKGKYNYDYSLENRSYKYICSGRKDGEEDNGECTSPEEVSYNKDTFKNVFDKLNIRYLDFSYIYNLIKNIACAFTLIYSNTDPTRS